MVPNRRAAKILITACRDALNAWPEGHAFYTIRQVMFKTYNISYIIPCGGTRYILKTANVCVFSINGATAYTASLFLTTSAIESVLPVLRKLY